MNYCAGIIYDFLNGGDEEALYNFISLDLLLLLVFNNSYFVQFSIFYREYVRNDI